MPPEAALAPPLATVRCQASAAPPATEPTMQRSAKQPKQRTDSAARPRPQPAHQQPLVAS